MANTDRLDFLLANTSQRFDVDICALSLHKEGDWDVRGNLGGLMKETIQQSKLFKVLLERAAPTIILDAQHSSLIKDDPLVAAVGGSQEIGFYMEIPLFDEGEVCIGALVLADGTPRLEDVPFSMVSELIGLARQLERCLAWLSLQSQVSEESVMDLKPVHQPRSATSSSASTSATASSLCDQW
mmetsp:Transcript_4295/g.7521  ORF Transcript_4295/g.7521 Transcript_4295/m.7521 type:complete len:184 (+) Transcript_4295:76-627(+)|eukprot:CAMPEP_0197626276 /NCGR_PEP_ID=MMETSP1338-20131121/5321_1 /TAXON_ID=43686 ORGANISM="Pelagodinium beii, Strain RCC1491" /NCGR_SAMPLE_ID=MMETSP1338 /ASSEMBLY_ACC=CAM_ASM_000754 /LENGTH=183 /DNA_ID=CAMNT_0043196805 /DNA_START=70 /DNA_END=618 /DNA_ORIENTATION=+